MPERKGSYTIQLSNRPMILSSAAVVGKKEGEGPLGNVFDRVFEDTHTSPSDYDLILTGDLAAVGSEMLHKLLEKKGYHFGDKHDDCGLMIYDRQKQDVHAGGSGCGCSAAVLCSDILQRMTAKKLHDVVFVGTGALMSPTTSQQGESIPGIAHLVHLVG